MTARVFQFPLSKKAQRVSDLCALINNPGPEPILSAREYQGSILIKAGSEVEIFLSVEVTVAFANALMAAAMKASQVDGR